MYLALEVRGPSEMKKETACFHSQIKGFMRKTGVPCLQAFIILGYGDIE
jgi:hypothetical protein